jgi:beta-glucosidase
MKWLLTLSVLCAFTVANKWMDPGATPEQRASDLLAQMTQDEKITMVHGSGGSYVGNVPANSRLGIPPLNLNDGPSGFRDDAHPGTTTQWPSAQTVTTTWDQDLLYQFGVAMGEEFVGKGANIQLGPGINVARVPVCGRNFEYVSGEDPYLGALNVAPIVRGIQSQHVIANAKHYINNNQEQDRGSVSADVDERTRIQIYFFPFWGAVKAGVGSFMCSYNKINSVYACENPQTLNAELKATGVGNYTGGWVMSDWGATHSTVNSANAGLDQEMPSSDFFNANALNSAISNGQVTQATLDNKVYRILVAMFTAGLFDIPQPTGKLTNDVTSSAHNTLARTLSANSIVLLKNNNNILPIPKTAKIGVFGKPAQTAVITGGWGSGQVEPKYQVTPLAGISNVLNANKTLSCDQEANTDYYQPGNPSAPGTSADDCCNQCKARGDCFAWTWQPSDTTCWFKPNDSGKQTSNGLTSGHVIGKVNVSYCESDTAQCTALAQQVDYAICVMATTSGEGSDRANLQLPADQTALCSAVGKANSKTIGVTINPGAILTPPWDADVAAIVAMFMPGQEEGNALADVLFGDVNPSGKLPVTFPNKDNEIGFTQQQYPGVNLHATYSEKLQVGYRWYTANNVKPAYPFGHGLSYTTFNYSGLTVSGRTVSATIQNTGSRDGAEVAQLYIGYPASAGEPPIQLRNYAKVKLAAGGRQTVSWTLADLDLSIWDATNHRWALQSGQFTISVGSSVSDIRLRGSLTV